MPLKKKAAPAIIKRRQKRVVGIFIDGISLDRATRRLNRKIEMSALVKSLCAGADLLACRYYTVIPQEDDSRQLAFIDAMSRSGLSVILKRLPPKGITRQVSTDTEMGSDIVAFASGVTNFPEEYIYRPAEPLVEAQGERSLVSSRRLAAPLPQPGVQLKEAPEDMEGVRRIIISVCPTHEMNYPISLANALGADTVTADFANPRSRNVMGSAAKWIDLSTSESIWRS